jgi:hypothetical protein
MGIICILGIFRLRRRIRSGSAQDDRGGERLVTQYESLLALAQRRAAEPHELRTGSLHVQAIRDAACRVSTFRDFPRRGEAAELKYCMARRLHDMLPVVLCH